MTLQPSDTAIFLTDEVKRRLVKDGANSALDTACTALESCPEHVPLILLHVSLLRRLGRRYEALAALLEKPVEMQRQALLRPCVELLIETGRLQEAKALHAQVEGEWTEKQPYQLASIVLMEQDGVAEAIELADEFCGKYPERQALWLENLRLRKAHHPLHDVIAWLDNSAPHLDTVSTKLAKAKFARSKGLWDDAIIQLKAVLEEDPNNLESHLLLTSALKDSARFEEALEICLSGLRIAPENIGLHTQHIDLRLKVGDKEGAAAAAYLFEVSARSNPRLQLSVSRCYLRLGQKQKAMELLEHSENIGYEPSLIAAIRADNLMIEKDVLGAREILQKASTIDPGRKELIYRLARVDMILGDLSEARAVLQKFAIDEGCEEASELLAEVALMMGDHKVSFELTEKSEHLPIQARQRRQALRIELFLSIGNTLEALKLAEEGLVEDPKWANGYSLRSRALVLLGKVDEAWESLKSYSNLASLQDPIRAVNKKPIQSILGQLINEFRLNGVSPTWELVRHDSDALFTAARFRDSLHDNPGDTYSAIGALASLKRSGQIKLNSMQAARGGRTYCIPRNIFQFWDAAEPPQQVSFLMNENRIRNSDFQYMRFDKRSAIEYLNTKGEENALRAFKLAPNAAGASDIFRLAVLWHEGGVYIDSDDLCLKPLSGVLRLDQRFIGYQEYLMSVGNNFIAVQPRDPVIRSALDEASSSFTGATGESPWLACGPGAISRAFVRELLEDDGGLARGVLLLPLADLRSFLATHIPLSYKASKGHWTSAFRPIV